MSAPKICPTCSAEYPVSERFCPKDGTALRAQTVGGTDLVGSVIAERYHVLRKLGEGGMGQVYLAEHVKMGRQSAVKVMHPAMVHDADALGRFNREAANASRVDHPNVAGIYDFGETPEGLVYLAMQFVEGETLTTIVREHGALPPHRAAEIARQAAEGLHAAHAMGIVHRDLKPDNIMVAKDQDGLDCVKVVDFGIAKAAGVKSQKVTRTGTVIGTPEYMSPEQLAGEEVDGRSDLYSLALVTFNMLTGDLPFPAETTQTAMIMRLTEKPRSLADMKPDVAWPSQVQAVMSKALEREASLRYATTREFGRALHLAIEKMPVRSPTAPRTAPNTGAAPEPATTVVASSPLGVTKRSLIIAAGIFGVLMVLAGGVLAVRGTFTQASAAPTDPTAHVAMARRARELNDLATANREAVTAVQLDPNSAAALRELASTLFLQQNYNGARTFFARAVKADPSDRLSQGFLGCSLIRLGRAEEGRR
ncbi:MAG: protein kinase domain-containing protein [Gemmatimonadaceae bacterium]